MPSGGVPRVCQKYETAAKGIVRREDGGGGATRDGLCLRLCGPTDARLFVEQPRPGVRDVRRRWELTLLAPRFLDRAQMRLHSTSENTTNTRAGRFITAGCPQSTAFYLGKRDAMTRLDIGKCDIRGLQRRSQTRCRFSLEIPTRHDMSTCTHGSHALRLDLSSSGTLIIIEAHNSMHCWMASSVKTRFQLLVTRFVFLLAIGCESTREERAGAFSR